MGARPCGARPAPSLPSSAAPWARTLDAACGIGTQAIGLAALGHRLHGTDLSPAALARARREATALGIRASFEAADMRDLGPGARATYGAVLCCDNTLAHLLEAEDLERAVAALHGRLRPGGLLLASIRDYDRLTPERPRTLPPVLHDEPGGRQVVFQVWDWDGPGSALDTASLFLVKQHGADWRTTCHGTRCRAWLRADLSASLERAGFSAPQGPEQGGFFQPLVQARRA